MTTERPVVVVADDDEDILMLVRATLTAAGAWATGLPEADVSRILDLIDDYGPVPTLEGVAADRLLARLQSDKKTLKGKVHFVLPVRIGEVTVVSGVAPALVEDAVRSALA